MKIVRYGLPALIIIAGITLAASLRTTQAVEGGALLISAGASVYLLNLLFRVGVKGDKQRDKEEAARRHYDQHGKWPD